MLRFSAAPRFRQSAPLLRRGRTCTPSRASRGQREPCQVKVSRAQRLRDPGILCLLPVPTGIALLALAKAALAGTLGCCRRIVFAVEVSPPSPQGAPVASDEGALGAPGSGGRKPLPGERRAPARAREGAGGAASSCAGRAGSGVDRPPRRGCPCLAAVADLCARSRWRPLGGPVFVARIRGLCWGFECISACGRPLLPAPAFRRFLLRLRPQVSGCLCRWRGLGLAALGGWRTSRSRGKRRHRCSLGHFSQGGQPGRKG